MPPQDWIRLGYVAGAIVALVAAVMERRRGDRAAMLAALLVALALLAASRFYNGGLRAFDLLTSIGATFAGAALLANASLRRRPPKA